MSASNPQSYGLAMENSSRKNQVKAEWTFVYLKTLMSEAPISVKSLAASSGVAEPTITRARSGKALKRETVVKLFDALIQVEKLEPILQNRQSDFLVKKGTESTVDIDQLLFGK